MQNECSYVIEYFRSHGNADLIISSTAALKGKQTHQTNFFVFAYVMGCYQLG